MIGVKSLIAASHGDVGISRRGIPQNGLVCYVPLWHTASQGATFRSFDHYRHLCTVTGAVWTPPNKGYLCDANDDKMVIPAHAAINNLTELTMLAVINPSGLADRFIDKGSGSKGFRIATGSKLRGFFYQGGAGTNASSIDATALTLNQRVMVGLTYSNSGDRKIYLWKNGVAVPSYDSQTAMVGTIATETTDDLILGTEAGYTNDFGGYFEEFLYYNRIWTAAEIWNYYLSTLRRAQ